MAQDDFLLLDSFSHHRGDRPAIFHEGRITPCLYIMDQFYSAPGKPTIVVNFLSQSIAGHFSSRVYMNSQVPPPRTFRLGDGRIIDTGQRELTMAANNCRRRDKSNQLRLGTFWHPKWLGHVARPCMGGHTQQPPSKRCTGNATFHRTQWNNPSMPNSTKPTNGTIRPTLRQPPLFSTRRKSR